MKQQLALSAISTLAYSIQMQAQGEPWKYNDPWQRLGVTMDGEDLDLFIVRTHWSDITPLGETGYNMGFNGRTYLSTSQDWNKDNYFRPNLLGGSMEYDVDLSQVSCGCNAALYTIRMPGVGSNGLPFESSDGLHYCDAASVGGNQCPEFDIMEANIWAWRATSHACDAHSNGFFDNCDKNGSCSVDIITDDHPETAYGPGAEFDINTLEEFHVKVNFNTDANGDFSDYVIKLTQGDRTVSLVANCPSDLAKMTEDLRSGMVFAMSVWEGDMSWLQHDRCSGSCSQQDLQFMNLQFNTAAQGEDDDTDTDEDDDKDTDEDTDTDEDEDTPVDLTDIEADFDAIKNNPHYSEDHPSRTNYQVDQTLDYIEEKLIEMAAYLHEHAAQNEEGTD